jgi:ABC-type Fe3+-hydroxamate transport system substrate-binding protein
MIELADDRHRRLFLAREPERIVSLVPSDSYNLAAIAGAERIVGRSAYCVEPALEAPIVGGTKNVDVEAVLSLAPDLVVANQEENRKVDIERLEAAGLAVLVSFPKNVHDGLVHVERLARLFPSRDNAERLAEARAAHARFSQRALAPIPAFVPIWMSPLMTIHGDTFISDALELAGGRNVFSDRARRYPLSADLGQRAPIEKPGRDTRYPRVTLEEVIARAPRVALLPDEPHPFDAKDAEVIGGVVAEVRFCQGKDLMWYGLRALEGLGRIAALLDELR